MISAPLKMLEQFRCLDGKRAGQILRRMELIPIALRGELAQRPHEPLQ